MINDKLVVLYFKKLINVGIFLINDKVKCLLNFYDLINEFGF